MTPGHDTSRSDSRNTTAAGTPGGATAATAAATIYGGYRSTTRAGSFPG